MKRALSVFLVLTLCVGITHAERDTEEEKKVVVQPTPWIAYQTAFGMSVVADAISQQQAYRRGYTEHNPLYSGFGNESARGTARIAFGALTMWGLTALHKKHPKAATRTLVALMLANFALAILHDKRCQPDNFDNPTCPPVYVPPCLSGETCYH